MIVRAFGGKLLLVRQTDHMVLSGQLAEAWGNDRFARPEPFAPLVRAAYEHDAGWADWEASPKVDPHTRLPYQFSDMPVEEHLAFYRRGVDAVAAKDAHAGLLVNLHCQGFHNQRFGTAPDLVMRQLPPAQEVALRHALAGLQAQQRTLGLQVGVEEPTLWTQYELLQIYDRLSLYLCMPPQKEAGLGPVPVGVGGERVALKLRPGGGDNVVVTPWPFREPSLVVGVEGRLVPYREYAGDEDFRQELAKAEATILTYSLKCAPSSG
jgi:hypothetical protein